MERRTVFKYLAVSAAGLATVPFWVDSWTTEKLPAVSLAVSNNQKLNLTALVEAIIPETNTPGATTLGVDQFVLTMVTDCFEEEQQRAFFTGLNKLEAMSNALNDKTFLQATESERLEILQQVDVVTLPGSGKEFDFALFIKDLTIMGYMNSEYVMKNILHYELVPSRFNGSYPVAKV